MSLFSTPYNIASFQPENKLDFKPRDLTSTELEDLKSMAQDISFSTYLENLNSRKRSYNGINEADTYYRNMVDEALSSTTIDDNSQQAITDQNKTKAFLSRFSKRENAREEELSEMAKKIGFENEAVGQIAFDEYNHDFRYGILGYHSAGLTGNMDGSQFELMTTNQNAIWAKTMRNFNLSMFEVSPAFEPKEIPEWTLINPTDSSKPFYVYSDGSPVTKGSLKLPIKGESEANELITPDTIVGQNKDGSPILAKDSIPMIIDQGLVSLKRNEFEESFYNYNVDTVNNFGRFGRVGDYGPADQTVLGFIDTTTIPVVNIIQSMFSPATSNPDIIARDYSPKINAKALVQSIKTRDPLWYFDMVQQGIDIDRLSSMSTAGQFRAYVNETYQKNAIARAMRSLEVSDGWWWNKFYEGREMVYGTLVSGDAVAQAGITLASLGTNLAVAGSLTVGRSTAGLTTTAARVAAVRAGVASNVSFGVKFAKTLGSVVRWLPANAPSTLVEMGLHKIPGFTAKAAEMGIVKGALVRSPFWFTGQVIEGAVEEGITDVVNQEYELALGLRKDYDWSQTWTQTWQGGLMEPLLGGILMGPTFAVGYTGRTVGRAGLNSTTRWFGLDQRRVQEFNFYLSTLNGEYDNLSPLDQQIRQEQLIRGLVMEEALKPISQGSFTKAETAMAKFANMASRLKGQLGNVNAGNFVNAALTLADIVEGWQKTWDTGGDVTNIEKARDLGLIIDEEDADGNVTLKLTENATELLLNFIVTGSLGDQGSTARKAFIDAEFKSEVRKAIKEKNADLVSTLENAKEMHKQNPDDPKTLEDLKNAVEALDKKVEELSNDPSFQEEKQQILQQVVNKTTVALELFPSDAAATGDSTFASTTETTLEMSQARVENALEPINTIITDAVESAKAEKEIKEKAKVDVIDSKVTESSAIESSEVEKTPVITDVSSIKKEESVIPTDSKKPVVSEEQKLTADEKAMVELLLETISATGIDQTKFQEFLITMIKHPKFTADVFDGLLIELNNEETADGKVKVIESYGCRKD